MSGLLSVHGSAHAYAANTTKSGHVIRWAEPAVVLHTDDAFDDMLPEGEAMAALTIAVEAWRGIGDAPDVVVREGDARPVGYADGERGNTITTLHDWPYEAEKLAVTVITYELDTGRLLDADVLVNAQAPFTLSAPVARDRERYDLAAVLTHEAGHFLGLGESEDDPRATMWPFAAPGDTHQRTLSDDDEESVIFAYSQRLPSMGCGQARVLGARPSGSHRALPALCLAGLGLILLRRRRWAALPAWLLALGLLATPQPGLADTETLAADVHAQHPALGLQSAEGQARLRALTADGAQLRFGRALRGAAAWRNGRLETHYTLRTEDGERLPFVVQGGVLDGIVQRPAEQLLPEDGAWLAVGADTGRWAFADGGVLHGGALAHGADLRLPAP